MKVWQSCVLIVLMLMGTTWGFYDYFTLPIGYFSHSQQKLVRCYTHEGWAMKCEDLKGKRYLKVTVK